MIPRACTDGHGRVAARANRRRRPYERPLDPDLRFDTTDADAEELAGRIVEILVERGIV